MQTQITEQFLSTPSGQEANDILRNCVHCGFCTATCPTYQLLGDELDGPRGRIYLIKQVLEGHQVTEKTQSHLDRCLTCRSCETTCPSGVKYGRLIDIGRELVEQKVVRDPVSRLKRFALRKILPHPGRFSPLLAIAQFASPVLPKQLQNQIPEKVIDYRPSYRVSETNLSRNMLLLEGCVQSVATPKTNDSARSLFTKLGINLFSVSSAGCCGAVSHHLSAEEEAHDFMRRNIDAWWPHIESGVEAIVITASGCGTQVKDYAHLLKHDKNYAEKAQRVSELAKDISEVISNETLPVQQSEIKSEMASSTINSSTIKSRAIAFHSPCTLQHGQKLNGVVEGILQQVGFNLTTVKDSHLCCGSAGTYSILQSELSQRLLENKVENLQAGSPEMIVTANIGCQMHINSHSDVPVKHWIELLDEVID